jgi:hypothetical protein
MGFWKDLLATHGYLPVDLEAPAPRGEGPAPAPRGCHPQLRLVRLESEELDCPPPNARSPRPRGGPVLGVHGLA